VLPSADVLIMAAAPADFQVAGQAAHKLKKGEGVPKFDLAETPDILISTIPDRRPGTIVIGFALETDNILTYALGKLRAKELDLIVANRAGEPSEGFGGDTNRVTFIDKDGQTEELPLMSKSDVAHRLLNKIGALIGERR
jgi:phosphopantothenoylcysteine decarboxylase/phosphopantothenate--cysteine ligase